MNWKVIKHIDNQDVEKIWCELYIDFNISTWNKKTSSPIIEIRYHDNKKEKTWFINKDQNYICPPRKQCEIKIKYFQRHPEMILYSNKMPYDDFTLDFCKREAIRLFSEKLKDILNQII